MYSGLIDKDKSKQPGTTNDDMFITASGRFIAPSSTLPRMRRSRSITLSLVNSAPITPRLLGAASRKRLRMLSRQSEEGQGEEETQSDNEYDEDYVVMSDDEDRLVTTSLPLRVR